MKRIISLAALLLLLAGCDALLLGGEEPPAGWEQEMEPPARLDDGLDVSSLAAQGVDPQEIERLVRIFHTNTGMNQRSFLLLRNGKLVLESYYNGWNGARKQDLRSASKSFTSALVGIAIDRGFIAGVDEPVLGYFGRYDAFANWDDRKAEMTVRDFLRMRTGLACNDWSAVSPGHEEYMYARHDWVKFVLDLPVAGAPGSAFSYCTGAPVTLGAVISNASGMEASGFAREFLFEPLGITDYTLEFKPDGEADTGGHFHMRPRDMAKFGQLFLNEGVWKGKQIVSREWVAESTAPGGSIPGASGLEYGYLWWTTSWSVDGRQVAAYFANGNGGQLIFVVPSLQLVAVFTGGRYNRNVLPGMLTHVEAIVRACRSPVTAPP